MQSDHRVPTINTTAMRQQHRKRSYSNGTFPKRDRHDLICVVCHAPAMGMNKFILKVFFQMIYIYLGYNFDQITCESCKAFFRRNALTNAVTLEMIFSFQTNEISFFFFRINLNAESVQMIVL